MSDIDCSIFNLEAIARISEWRKGDPIIVEGNIHDVTFGSIQLDPCTMTKR